MTTRPEIAFEALPVQSDRLTATAEILVSVGGTERRATVDLLPAAVPPTPADQPTIERYDVTGDASPAAGSIAGDSYGYTIAMGHVDQIAVARIVGFAGTAPHPSAVAVIVTLQSTDYASATGTIAIPAGVTLAAGATYTLRLQVFATGQRLTDEPAAYSDYRITAPAPGGGLNEAQVDARVRAIVEAPFRDGATGAFAESRIPSTIARTSALAGLQTAAQVTTAINAALTPYSTTTQITRAITTATAGLQTAAQVHAAVAGASHVRDRGAWSNAATYAVHDLASEDDAWYLGIAASTPSNAAAARPGVGTSWQTYWVRLGSPIPPGQPTIQQYDVTGDAAPAPGDIGGDTYRYRLALGNPGSVGAARIVGFTGNAPHPAKSVLSLLATIAQGDYSDASGSVTIPDATTLAAGGKYTLRLEVYASSKDPATDAPAVYHDYVITAVAPPTHPSISSYTVTGTQHPTAGSIAGDSYSATYAVAHSADVAAARIVGYKGSTSHPAKNAVTVLATISADDYASGTAALTIPAGISLTAGQSYTLRLEVYETGQTVDTDQPYAQADYQITAVAPAPQPSISSWTVTGDQTPPAGDIGDDQYRFSYAIANVGGIGAARIVAFAGHGGTPAKNAVTSRVSIDAGRYASGHGTLTIPSGVSLTEGQTYTLRLEVYRTGQTVATDQPYAHSDYVITAGAAPPTTVAHFGWVRADQDETDIDFSTTDQTTNATAVGYSWTVSGIPATGTYRLYAVVPASDTQPSHFTVGGRNQDNLLPSIGDHTIAGNSYTVYLAPTFFPVDQGYNGQIIVIS